MLCQFCETKTKYTHLNTPICFDCICRLEVSSPIINILREVSKITGVSIPDLKSKSKERGVAESRWIFFYLCRKLSSKSLAVIGSMLNQDHSTVKNGLNEINNLLELNKDFKNKYGAFIANFIEKNRKL